MLVRDGAALHLAVCCCPLKPEGGQPCRRRFLKKRSRSVSTVGRSRVRNAVITPSDSPTERDQVTRYYWMCLHSTAPRDSFTYGWGLHHAPTSPRPPNSIIKLKMHRAPFKLGYTGALLTRASQGLAGLSLGSQLGCQGSVTPLPLSQERIVLQPLPPASAGEDQRSRFKM